jgi:hypothetical protein
MQPVFQSCEVVELAVQGQRPAIMVVEIVFKIVVVAPGPFEMQIAAAPLAAVTAPHVEPDELVLCADRNADHTPESQIPARPRVVFLRASEVRDAQRSHCDEDAGHNTQHGSPALPSKVRIVHD